MSEQPPRASGHLPLPGEATRRGLEPDPEAPAMSAAPLTPGFEGLESAYTEPDPEERIRTRAGEGLDRAADAARRLGHRVRDQGGVVGHAEPIAYRVGDSLQSAAEYVRAHDLIDMRDDVEHGVRRSPLKALAIAAVGGFLLGRMLR